MIACSCDSRVIVDFQYVYKQPGQIDFLSGLFIYIEALLLIISECLCLINIFLLKIRRFEPHFRLLNNFVWKV